MNNSKHFLWHGLLAAFVALLFGASEMEAADTSGVAPLASIRIYNPTAWDGPLPVEVPLGQLATPGLIDWNEVHLAAGDGHELPFAVREGRPHWKAGLVESNGAMQPEDLLVFSVAVKPHSWLQIDILPGSQKTSGVLTHEDGKLVVAYPNQKVTIDSASGMLLQWEVFEQPLLSGPMNLAISKGRLDVSCPANAHATWVSPKVAFEKNSGADESKETLAIAPAQLVTQTSNAAMTEIHFILKPSEGPALAVSYRIHSDGLLEIRSDERPWAEQSPWLEHKATFDFPLGGQVEPLPLLMNRAPYYGFKDTIAVVNQPAALHHFPQATVLELGEDTFNGRRWERRLYPISADKTAQAKNLVDAADKGWIVEAIPKTMPLPAGEIRITYPEGSQVAAQTIAEALKDKGREATCVEAVPNSGSAAVELILTDPQKSPAIEGDGYRIESTPDGKGLRAIACTRFGLMQASLQIANHMKKCGDAVSLPLVAGNPAAAIRAGGFGGGNFEVDFPYGTDEEWHAAFDAMIASGMNVMTAAGMWSNWKMPISYRDMPELRSDAADAYDEVSGAKLSEIDSHREHGLRLMQYLHDRGVKVWLWLPVGCVPTTYSKAHPEAMAPNNDRCPCTTDPQYAKYLEAFLTELLATYPIDGFVMIRDDNGGNCPCDRCKKAVADSATQNAAWEQYLILYRWLKSVGFKGDIAVYPYYDIYEPRLDRVLPPDLQIVGHGSAATMLSRNYASHAPMGDTWLDNPLASFRMPTSARMRRLLSDRNSYWLGGAFFGSELPWESIGRFGWEPTATVNTLRYEHGLSQFGSARALEYVALADAYEQLWDIYNLPMLPQEWMKLDDTQRAAVVADGKKILQLFGERLAGFEKAVGPGSHELWCKHAALYGDYFAYHLQRLENFAQMHALVVAHPEALTNGEGLPAALREQMIALHRQIYDLSDAYDRRMAETPEKMLESVRHNQMTRPFKEWVGNYDGALDRVLKVRQFAGVLEAAPPDLKAGEPFVLRIQLQNTGVCPWMPKVGHKLEISSNVEGLGLPKQWEYDGDWMVFGDRREIELHGVAPKEPGEAQCSLTFFGPSRNYYDARIIHKEITLHWK